MVRDIHHVQQCMHVCRVSSSRSRTGNHSSWKSWWSWYASSPLSSNNPSHDHRPLFLCHGPLSDAPDSFSPCSCTTSHSRSNLRTRDTGPASGTFFSTSTCNMAPHQPQPIQSCSCSKSQVPSSCSSTQCHGPCTYSSCSCTQIYSPCTYSSGSCTQSHSPCTYSSCSCPTSHSPGACSTHPWASSSSSSASRSDFNYL